MTLTDDQLDRYARHLVMKEIGGPGQQRLLKARVLIVGAGGLGSPLAMYLAAAGVGTLGIIDDDTVTLSNLQRQILHDTAHVGMSKTDSAAITLRRLNPEIRIEPHGIRLTTDNAADLAARYDIVADGSDSFATRFAVNEVCVTAGRTLVSAAVIRFDGQLSTYKPHDTDGSGARRFPCYRCIVPEGDEQGDGQGDGDLCSQIGVLGAAAGVMGSLQATEVIKEILGIGRSMAGRLLLWDFLSGTQRTVTVAPDPACVVCGAHATDEPR